MLMYIVYAYHYVFHIYLNICTEGPSKEQFSQGLHCLPSSQYFLDTFLSKIKIKKDCFGKKEHTNSRKLETQFDWVSSYATL